jgi:hypothetical protein
MQQWETERADRIAQALNLDEAKKAKVKATLDSYAEKERPLHTQLQEDLSTIKAASEGDKAAGAKLDTAISDMKSVRQKALKQHDALFNDLSKGLNEQERAKLLIAMAPPWEQGMHGKVHAPPNPTP